MEKELICIICPIGCRLTIDPSTLEVTGNNCPRGAQYARKELENPTRTLTTTIAVANGKSTMVSCKSSEELPKELLFKCMDIINKVVLEAPIGLNQILIKNILETGVDIIATSSVAKE